MTVPSSGIESGAKRPPLCATAPLLWSLAPLIAGIFAAKLEISPWIPVIAVFSLARAVPGRFMASSLRRLVLPVSFILGWILMDTRTMTPETAWSHLPPREVEGVLVIEELFAARKPGRISGIGKLLQVNVPDETLTGIDASFYLDGESLSEGPGLGQKLSFRAVLHYLPFLENKEGFHEYLENRDIFLSLNQGSVLKPSDPPPPWERLRLGISGWAQRILITGCDKPEDPGFVLASMILGKRALLTDQRVALYRNTGTYHLFAVSGLHVGSFALCLHLLMRILGIPGLIRAGPVLLLLWGYVWITGSSPSATRAGLMISSVVVVRYMLRQPHLFPALVLSAWLVLIMDPRQLFDLGFQLSYSVMGSIILIGLPLSRYSREQISKVLKDQVMNPRQRFKAERLTGTIIDILCVSASASAASAPLIIEQFGIFTPAGMGLGAILNPLAVILVMCGALAILFGPLLTLSSTTSLIMLTWPVIRLVEWVLQQALEIPGAFSMREWIWAGSGYLVLLSILGMGWLMQHARQSGRSLPAFSYLLPFLTVLAAIHFGSVSS